MAILSITFHTVENTIKEWDNFVKNELIPNIQSFDKKYILTEVETEMLSEGKNTNLLLFFENQRDRILFLEQTFPLIFHKILSHFQENVLIFKTFLNTIK